MSLQREYLPQQSSYQIFSPPQTSPNILNWYVLPEKYGDIHIEMKDSSAYVTSEMQPIEIMLEPVYVTKKDEESVLMYDSLMMQEGERYVVMWKGVPFALVKEGNNVVIYKGQIEDDKRI